ncbi:MAG: DUF2189 domain-containing protein [Burkholderiaceae bacterium]|nr:DUF2189 domain-containing protein [Burkholderiaceae bacterium]
MSSASEQAEKAVTIDLRSPWRWLRLGLMDFIRNPLPGLMHGLALSLFGLVLFIAANDHFWLLAGAFSGFLIVAPIMATGLYAVSRHASEGQKVCCREVLQLWLSGDRRMMGFGLLLAFAGTGWVLTSAGLITLWAPAPIEKPVDFFQHVVLGPSPGLFEVWVLLGALLAAPVFASSVVTIPLLMDTQTPLWEAVGLSWSVVGSYPVVMALWACLIVLLVGFGLATLTLGLLVVVPVLGHASWHAYADLKRAGALRHRTV